MIEVVAGIVLDGGGQILLAQRPPHKSFAGFWEFPGGKVEVGEDLESALARELGEELSLSIEITSKLGSYLFQNATIQIHLHVFVVRACGPAVASLEVQLFRWSKPESILAEELTPADREPLNYYLKTLTGPRSSH